MTQPASGLAMPWIAPVQPITREIMQVLDRPLVAVQTGDDFDAKEFYAQFERREVSRLERQIEAAGSRPQWRIEEVELPDAEDSDEAKAAYDEACVQVAGRLLVPRCLDAYTMFAYGAADFDGEPDDRDAEVSGDLDEALEWAAAGVCVLQQSLPWPFTGVLSYKYLDHRSAHRLLFAYALLLRQRHPRKAAGWFRAMVYLDPEDHMGARSFASSAR